MRVHSNNTKSPFARGYSEAGASTDRRAFKGFTAESGSPNEDINWNNATLRQRGRMLYMSSPIATSAIKTLRTKVVGIGLALKSSVNRKVLGLSPEAARDWQKKTEAEFKMWASKKENCDALGLNNFGGLQQLAMMSWLTSGDVIVLLKRYERTPNKPYTLRLHIIEADRISTPTEHKIGGFSILETDGKNEDTGNEIHDGVEVDAGGMVVAYHIRNTYPNEITFTDEKWTRVEAYGEKTGLPNILHIMSSERPEQYRGVTFLAQVIEPLLQIRRYTESELMAAVIQSFFTAWIKTESDTSEFPLAEVGEGEVAGIPSANPLEDGEGVSSDPNEYEMGPGTTLHLGEKESVEFGQPTSPNTGFDKFVQTMCRLIGAALEIPHDVLMKEYNRSYSASRAALLEMYDTTKTYRKWFVDDFPQAVYEIWLSEAIATGRIKAPGYFTDPLIRDAWSEARWIGPVQGHLDPVKEIKAAIMANDHAYKTHEQITYEVGGVDWEENVEQLERENELLKKAGGGNVLTALNGLGADDDSDNEGED